MSAAWEIVGKPGLALTVGKNVQIIDGKRAGQVGTLLQKAGSMRWFIKLKTEPDAGKQIKMKDGRLQRVEMKLDGAVGLSNPVSKPAPTSLAAKGKAMYQEAVDEDLAKKVARGQIPPPPGYPGLGYKASMSTITRGAAKKFVVTYTISHDDGRTTILELTIDFDGKETSKKTEKAAPAGFNAGKAAAAAAAQGPGPVQPPPDLPDGAGWKAQRAMSTRSDGKRKTVTTYTVARPNGTSYRQVVTLDFNGTTTVSSKKALL